MKPTRHFLIATALLGAFALSSCSGRFDARFGAEGGASLNATIGIPAIVGAKLRALSGLDASTPIFDPSAVSRALLVRKGIASAVASCPDPDSLSLSATISDLGALLASPDLSSLIKLDNTEGAKSLTIRLSRDHGQDILALLPGIDPGLVEALSPPALGGGDYTKVEYRDALQTILGTKAMPAFDAASVDLSVSVPGAIVSSSGGRVAGSTWKASIPLLDLLVLEKPLVLSFSWR